MGFHRDLTNLDLHAPTNFNVTNDTVSVIPALTVVKAVDIDSDVLSVEPISSFTDKMVGVTREPIASGGGEGTMSNVGVITGVDTSAWTKETELFADDDGSLTVTNTGLFVATVLSQDATNGAIFVQLGLKGDTGTPGLSGEGVPVGVVLSSPGSATAHPSITAAMAAAVSGDIVYVGPGVYAESFTIPDGVSLVGASFNNTIISGAAATGTRITILGTTRMHHFTVVLPTDAAYGIDCTLASGNTSIESMIFVGVGGVGTAVHVDNASAFSALTMREVTHSGDCARFIHHEVGIVLLLEVLIAAGTFSSSVFLSEGGANSIFTDVQIGDFVVAPTGMEVADAIVDLVDTNFRGGTTGIQITDDTADVTLRSANFFPALTNHIVVDPGLTDGKLRIFGGQVSQAKFDAPLAWWANADVGFYMFDEVFNTNDKSLRVLDEFVVGHPYKPGKVNLGGGDNYSLGMVVLQNTIEEIGTWSDITEEAFSIDGSTFDIFPGITVGSATYIGGDVPFKGLKATVSGAPIVLGALGALEWQIWDGASWQNISVMCSQIVPPLEQYADTVFERVQAEHIHLPDVSGWATKALDGITKYWLRVRVATAITATGALEEFKLLPDRVKFGLAGEQSMFGDARVTRNLPWSLQGLTDIAGASPANQTIFISPNISLARVDNQFNNSTIDARGAVIRIPFGLDTTIPLQLTVEWLASSSAAGDVELEATYAAVRVGDVLDGTLPETVVSSVSTGPQTVDVLRQTVLEIPVDHLVPGDQLALRIFRDANAGNLEDTYQAAIELVSTSLIGTFWR